MFKIKGKTKGNFRINLSKKTITIPSGIEEMIKKDKDLWYGFQANIAMQFQDHYHHYKRLTNKKYLNREDIHKISNDAANAFLNVWLHDYDPFHQ